MACFKKSRFNRENYGSFKYVAHTDQHAQPLLLLFSCHSTALSYILSAALVIGAACPDTKCTVSSMSACSVT